MPNPIEIASAKVAMLEDEQKRLMEHADLIRQRIGSERASDDKNVPWAANRDGYLYEARAEAAQKMFRAIDYYKELATPHGQGWRKMWEDL